MENQWAGWILKQSGKVLHTTYNKDALADAYQVGILSQREKHQAIKS